MPTAYWTIEYAQITKTSYKTEWITFFSVPSISLLFPGQTMASPFAGRPRQVLVYYACTTATSIPLPNQFDLKNIPKSAMVLLHIELWSKWASSLLDIWNNFLTHLCSVHAPFQVTLME